MKKIIFCAILTVTLFSCKTKNKKETVSKNYEIQITTKDISKDEVDVNIKTNFPDKTSFTVTASRDYTRKNNNEQYAGQLAYLYNESQKNGQISFKIKVDDKKWINEYNDIKKQNQEFDNSLTEIEKIKDSIEINVLYTPKGKQSQKVIEELGVNGENIKGKGLEKVGDFYIFEKSIKIHSKVNN
ncbi:hypothetical protein [Tenacibaculum dicentrarchi]|uniref:hypothetical protein n=1 Tax=Tenacibaculum dicentrarchi TaxID=669041 RepID=UPI000C797818|nr:hypothetical protein TDCHD05_210001 [Tenacibaculum dicentrarchi]